MSMPLEQELTSSCLDCAKGLRHCHGTALVSRGTHVCSDDPDCTLNANEHWFISDSLDEN